MWSNTNSPLYCYWLAGWITPSIPSHLVFPLSWSLFCDNNQLAFSSLVCKMSCSEKLPPLVTPSVYIISVNERSLSALFSKQHAGCFASSTTISYTNMISSLFSSLERNNFPLHAWVIIQTFPCYLVEDVPHWEKSFISSLCAWYLNSANSFYCSSLKRDTAGSPLITACSCNVC